MSIKTKIKTVRNLALFLVRCDWNGELPEEYKWWEFLKDASDEEIKLVVEHTETILDAVYNGQKAYTDYSKEKEVTI